jgi:hypothetical protein
MSTIATYAYPNTSPSRHRLLTSGGAWNEVVRHRDGFLHTAVWVQSPSATPPCPPSDLSSIVQQLFRLFVALLKRIFELWVFSLKPAAKACVSLNQSFLRRLDRTLNKMPGYTQLIEATLKSQTRVRMPVVWVFVCRTVGLPAQLLRAIIDFKHETSGPAHALPVQGEGSLLELQIDTAVSFRLMRLPLTLNPNFDNTKTPTNITQASVPSSLSDVPTLEDRSVPGYTNDRLLDYSHFSNGVVDTDERSQPEAMAAVASPKLEMTADEQFRGGSPDLASFELHETRAPIAKGTFSGQVEPLEPPQAFPRVAIRPLHNSDRANLDYAPKDPKSKHYGQMPTEAKISSTSSETAPRVAHRPLRDQDKTNLDYAPGDHESKYSGSVPTQSRNSSATTESAHAESFSPVQLSLPYLNRNEPLSGLHTLSTSLSGNGNDFQQPSQTPSPTEYSPTPSTDQPQVSQESLSPATEEDTILTVRKWARQSQSNPPTSKPTFSNPFHETDEADYCASETASCCDDPFTTSTRAARQQRRSETSECNEACISCETCDRRHKRVRGSRIPRRTKTLDQLPQRASSFTGCPSEQMTGGTVVVRRKLQKRKVKT